MTAAADHGTTGADSLASLERLKQVELDADERLRVVREKIDRALAHLREESEAQIQAARDEAEKGATTTTERARVESEAEAALIVSEAKTALARRSAEGSADLSTVWDRIRGVLFDEFA